MSRLIPAPPANTIGGLTATPGTGAGNVISGNSGYGVDLTGTGTASNIIEGNLIGTNAGGTASLGNESGIQIVAGSTNNTIGGGAATARNVISGNSADFGVSIGSSGTTGNLVEGNYIGTDVTGTVALPNSYGIALGSSGGGNTIGGATSTPGTGAGNLISGNDTYGIYASDEPAADVILGNVIGLSSGGTALANGGAGISLQNDTGVQIGGLNSQDENVISGNTNGLSDDVGVQVISSTSTLIEGNLIGTNLAGTAALPNDSGIEIGFGSANTIGGTAAGAGNVVSGSEVDAVAIIDSTTDLVEGNLVGTDLAGTSGVPNQYGIVVYNSSTHITIGGTVAAARNVVSGNTVYAIYIKDAGTSDNLVEGNYVGTDVTGTVALPNSGGVVLQSTSGGNTIGGATAAPGTGAGNLVAANVNGIDVQSETATDLILGNLIGLSTSGAAIANGTGVLLQYSAGLQIGGPNPQDQNVISGNGFGIDFDINDTGTLVEGNLIGTNVAGTAASPNNIGVYIGVGSTGNTIGATTGAPSNLISGNTTYGGRSRARPATSSRVTISAPTSPVPWRSPTARVSRSIPAHRATRSAARSRRPPTWSAGTRATASRPMGPRPPATSSTTTSSAPAPPGSAPCSTAAGRWRSPTAPPYWPRARSRATSSIRAPSASGTLPASLRSSAITLRPPPASSTSISAAPPARNTTGSWSPAPPRWPAPSTSTSSTPSRSASPRNSRS